MIDVIHNPVAGPKGVKRIDRVRAYLSARGLPFRIRETSAPGDAVVMAREAALAGADVVVAVGGDGTMNEVADGLAGSATPLAFVPHGTGNVFAREFSLPESVEGCLDLLSTGKTISVRMAKANERRFVLLASAGFDAEVVERMHHRQKNLLGIAAYVLAGARHLLRSQPTLWLEFPGRERVEAQSVIVTRGRKYGGNVTIAPGGDISGDTFQVIALLLRPLRNPVRLPGRRGVPRAASGPVHGDRRPPAGRRPGGLPLPPGLTSVFVALLRFTHLANQAAAVGVRSSVSKSTRYSPNRGLNPSSH